MSLHASPDAPAVRIRLPATHAARIGGLRNVPIHARCVGAGLRELTARHPALQRLIWLDADTLNPVIMVFLNEELIREDSLDTPLADGDTVDVVPAVESG